MDVTYFNERMGNRATSKVAFFSNIYQKVNQKQLN